MWTSAIIEVEVAADRSPRLADAVVGSQIDLLVLDAAPQAFDEHVVAPSALAVHADSNPVVGERADGNRGDSTTTPPAIYWPNTNNIVCSGLIALMFSPLWFADVPSKRDKRRPFRRHPKRCFQIR